MCGDIEDFIEGIQCCIDDATYKRNSYLVSFQVDEFKMDEDMFKHVEHEVANNKAMFQSLIYRCKYDAA